MLFRFFIFKFFPVRFRDQIHKFKMKLISSLLLLFVQITASLAQDSLKVTEVKKNFSKGNYNGYSVKIPQARLKDVVSDWKKNIHQKNKISVKEIDGEYFLAKTIIPELSPDSVIIYSTITANPTDVEIVSFLSGNDSVFYSTSSNPVISSNISTFIRNFATNEYRIAVTNELSIEQKTLKTLEENLKDLENENDRYEKKIKANERANERTQEEIKSNLQLQELKSSSILQQQKVLATYLTPSDQKNDEEKKLKALQKEKRKLKRENESLHNNIEEKENDIKALQKKIDKNNSDIIPAKQEEIKKQKKVITAVETKIKGIR